MSNVSKFRAFRTLSSSMAPPLHLVLVEGCPSVFSQAFAPRSVATSIAVDGST